MTTAPDEPRVRLGGNIRSIRRARGLTLHDVASRSGISEGWLSQVERGRSAPSLEILYNIATSLGIAVHDLFDKPNQAAVAPLSEADRPRIEWGEGGAYKTLVTTRPDSAVDLFVGHFPPEASTGEAYTHGDSSEVLLVLTGRVVATVDGRSFELAQGSRIEYRTSQPHQIVNPSDAFAEVLWAVSPPTSGTAVTRRAPPEATP